MNDSTDTILFNVNGRDIEVKNPDPETSLAEYLRIKLGLTGTKIGCEEGACGSCTVVIGKWNEDKKKAHYSAVNACLYPLFLADNCLVLTVEGIGNPQKMHPIQERLAKGHGTQCGFCSPGFIMSAYALFRNNPSPTKFDVDMAIKGNYCRCTGYRPIIEAFYSFTNGGCCQGKNGNKCPCKAALGGTNGFQNNTTNGAEKSHPDGRLVSLNDLPNIDPTQEFIFPPSLLLRPPAKSLHLIGDRVELFSPVKEDQLWTLPISENTRVISSGMITRLVAVTKPKMKETWHSIHRIPEYSSFSLTDDAIIVGSSLSVAKMMQLVGEFCEDPLRNPILNLYSNYSSLQVSNLATWTGAICSSRKLNETQTLFLALNLEVEVYAQNGEIFTLKMDDFIVSYFNLKSKMYIKSVKIPRKLAGKMFTLKHGARIGGDEPIVNFAAILKESDKIDEARVTFGLHERPFLAKNISEFLVGKNLSPKLENDLIKLLDQDLRPHSKIPDFDYKKRICIAALTKMINNEKQEFWRFDFSSSQIYKDTTNPNDSCGRPLATQFADRSVTGDAVYVGDIQMKDALHLAFVLSTVAHANIKSIDISEAKKVPGFVDFVDVHDVPALNQPGLLDFNMTDDNTPIFAAGKVECIGQIVGAVVCEDDKIARRTAKLVKIEYEPLDAILTMEKAIEAKSYLSNPFELGTPVEQIKKALQESDTVFEGETRGGPQEHLYMEPNCTVAVPGESNEWIIHCSTQSSGAVQHQIAAVLGIPANKVVMKVKRLGGGFGGKAFQAGYIAIATAVAAHKLKRPVSTVLSRKDDMAITGKRHPFISKYRVGLDKEKNIQAVDFETYFNAGWAHDVSKEVNMVYVSRSDQSFKFPHMRTWGVPLKTNTVSNTAFRGFGQPQAHFVIENMMLRVAHELGKEFEELCSSYFAKCGDINISGHTIRNDMLQSCWSECKKLSDFDKRKMDVDEFNRSSKSHKRGIAMTSCRFGMTHFGALEQGVALVQIYLDGSVALSIGGVEMGQGLNQKCIQIASRALGISADRITILDSSTDRTANAPETGGSIGADLHGLAVKNACEEILSRFAPLVKKYGSWDKAAGQAFLTERVSLRAVGYGTIDREKYNVGMEETYYTTGAACAEVEIDAATGEHKVLRVDIVMDLGDSLNPAIDIGQIEGAFTQGYGYLTSEEMLFNDDGSLQTNSAYGYKIPTVPMTPAKFNVKLLEKGMNFPQQVYGSKGVGEPPLLLGFSVYAALHKAIMSRRKGLNHTEWIEMSAPLTAKKIVQFCNP